MKILLLGKGKSIKYIKKYRYTDIFLKNGHNDIDKVSVKWYNKAAKGDVNYGKQDYFISRF